MTPERWEQISRVYNAAMARDERERASFVAEACAGDAALRREVDLLLAQAASGMVGIVEEPALATVGPAETPDRRQVVGRRIGVYELTAAIGAGGMGEVYRARDTRLGRDVAIKILPEAFTADSDRLRRLEREARLLAALNHPNIATIYGLEGTGSSRAIAMELVDGETLAERISRARGKGGVPTTEALRVARQSAEALDAAHEKGIVHRDLKPANIKVTRDGVVKVLDFGLAKLAPCPDAAVATHAPTVSIEGTQDGMIVGTAAYMSPEQARGESLDKRADIWAFGCVLYEMLAGRAAFARPTITDTFAAILEREPDWTAVPAHTPPPIRRLLRRCLEKDRTRRLADIAD